MGPSQGLSSLRDDRLHLDSRLVTTHTCNSHSWEGITGGDLLALGLVGVLPSFVTVEKCLHGIEPR